MKFSYVSVLFAASASALDIGKLLGGLKPLLSKAKCAAPCYAKASDGLKCGDKGPLSTICENLEMIAMKGDGCAKNCGIHKGTSSRYEQIM